MTRDKQSINITLADRSYPLRVAVEDEEKIRAAVKIINEKVNLYRERYANRDTQDALSMALLQFVIKLIETEEQQNISPIIEELQNLDTLLEDYIRINLS